MTAGRPPVIEITKEMENAALQWATGNVSYTETVKQLFPDKKRNHSSNYIFLARALRQMIQNKKLTVNK